MAAATQCTPISFNCTDDLSTFLTVTGSGNMLTLPHFLDDDANGVAYEGSLPLMKALLTSPLPSKLQACTTARSSS